MVKRQLDQIATRWVVSIFIAIYANERFICRVYWQLQRMPVDSLPFQALTVLEQIEVNGLL